MKKLFILSFLFSFVFLSCNNEPEPEPEVIRAFCNLFHFIPELGSVRWEIDDVAIPEEQPYAIKFSGGILLDAESEEISFTVKHSGTNQVLVSELFLLEKDKNYNAIVYGLIEDPLLLIQEIETTQPASGNVKFQILHSIAGQGPIDVYMGGSTADKKAVSDIEYLSLSAPFEAVDYDVRAAITVTAHSEEYHQDSVLISAIYNDIIVSGANYLSVVAPSTFNPADTLLTFWLYELPLD